MSARASGGGMRIRRAAGLSPRAALRDIALAGGGAADRRARGKPVRRAIRTRAGAGFGDVARARRRPADGARPLESIGRTGASRAGLRDITHANGGAADVPQRGGSDADQVPVAGVVRRADVAVVARLARRGILLAGPLPDALAREVATRRQGACRGVAGDGRTRILAWLPAALLDGIPQHAAADTVSAVPARVNGTGGAVTQVLIAIGAP